VFYWDNEGNIIFGYIHSGKRIVPVLDYACISDNNVQIGGPSISGLVMQREFAAGEKIMSIDSGALPVHQMLLCFEHKYFEPLSKYLANLSSNERNISYRKCFGHQSVSNPKMTIWYRKDKTDFKKVQNVFPDIIDGNKLVDISKQ
jgi:hypothetical protein